MAYDIARRSYRDVTTLGKPGERKHAAVSFGIATDKVLILSNRPAQIVGFAEAECMRAPLRELGVMIAAARGTDMTRTPSGNSASNNSSQTRT